MNIASTKKADKIFERFKRDYPNLAMQVARYYMDGRYLLTLEYDDGTMQLWDEFNRMFLPVSNSKDFMTADQYRIDIGQRISRVMIRKSITQEKLSEMTGISQTQLSRYISGRVMPNFIALDKITRALRMSLDELRHIDLENEIDCY